MAEVEEGADLGHFAAQGKGLNSRHQTLIAQPVEANPAPRSR